ncbi:hypothetical protein L596_021081 [Steinernema carpocapsae]|uniref:Uncharacterized protein n=1 Tax=Steinernema carpocapsae TaxID=34508 RepID=A0A4U5MVN1_STECR|nr:hypothetical protein L596_021081 [Steinernema carpocapsae]
MPGSIGHRAVATAALGSKRVEEVAVLAQHLSQWTNDRSSSSVRPKAAVGCGRADTSESIDRHRRSMACFFRSLSRTLSRSLSTRSPNVVPNRARALGSPSSLLPSQPLHLLLRVLLFAKIFPFSTETNARSSLCTSLAQRARLLLAATATFSTTHCFRWTAFPRL